MVTVLVSVAEEDLEGCTPASWVRACRAGAGADKAPNVCAGVMLASRYMLESERDSTDRKCMIIVSASSVSHKTQVVGRPHNLRHNLNS